MFVKILRVKPKHRCHPKPQKVKVKILGLFNYSVTVTYALCSTKRLTQSKTINYTSTKLLLTNNQSVLNCEHSDVRQRSVTKSGPPATQSVPIKSPLAQSTPQPEASQQGAAQTPTSAQQPHNGRNTCT